MSNKICKKCNAINDEKNTYCVNCGTEIKNGLYIKLIILNIINFLINIGAFILFLNFRLDGSSPAFFPSLILFLPAFILCVLGLIFSIKKRNSSAVGLSVASTSLSSPSFVVILIHIVAMLFIFSRS